MLTGALGLDFLEQIGAVVVGAGGGWEGSLHLFCNDRFEFWFFVFRSCFGY